MKRPWRTVLGAAGAFSLFMAATAASAAPVEVVRPSDSVLSVPRTVNVLGGKTIRRGYAPGAAHGLSKQTLFLLLFAGFFTLTGLILIVTQKGKSP